MAPGRQGRPGHKHTRFARQVSAPAVGAQRLDGALTRGSCNSGSVRRLVVIAATAASLCWALALSGSASAGLIVFSSDRCAGGANNPCGTRLWTVSDDGAGLAQITPFASEQAGGESRDDQPAWSPDGRIAYRRVFDAQPLFHSLWIASPDGSSERQLGPSAPNDLYSSIDEPEWSPDGRLITFIGRPTNGPRIGGLSAIWTINTEDASVRQLSDGTGTDSSPSFSPDGRRIAFTRSVRGPAGAARALLTMDLDGTDIAPVALGTPPQGRALPGTSDSLRASWSPDGQQIAFAYRDAVYTVRSDGTSLEYRGRTGSPFSQLEWSSEPTPGLIFSRPFEPAPLYRIDLSGPSLEPRPITPPPTFDPSAPPGAPRDGDNDPDWRPAVPSLSLHPPELDPPVAIPLAGGSGTVGASANRGALRVRRQQLGFLALDPSGVRRLSASIARRTPGTRGRCRLLGRRGLGRRRACARSLWHRLRGPRDLSRRVARVPPGRYLLRLRASDELGNVKRRPPAFKVVLRR